MKDQEKALRFYTETLGFVKKTEVPMGEHKWLTVVSKEEPDGVEVVLGPAKLAVFDDTCGNNIQIFQII